MAQKPKPLRALVPIPAGTDLTTDFLAAAESLATNPAVAAFSIDVNKDSGIIKTKAVGHAGQAFTQALLGPGLTSTTTFVPSGADASAKRAARDSNIVTLSKTLKQTEIADTLNVSQSLVSMVLRREGVR